MVGSRRSDARHMKSIAEGMADRQAAGKTDSPYGEMQKRAEKAEADLATERGNHQRQVAGLLESLSKSAHDLTVIRTRLKDEAGERRALTNNISAIALMLGRCGEGELVISKMLFGALRFHGSPGIVAGDDLRDPE